MFTSARLKLTGWYLLIIMLVSISFSVAIYNALTIELNRIEQMQKDRMERRVQLEMQLPDAFRAALPPAPDYGLAEIESSKYHILFVLALIDLAILILSSGAGFFLAGRTLKPIKEMVDEQHRFITDASHELRTPLTALKTSIEVNLRDKEMTLADSKELLKSNLEDVNSLQALSDNLLILAKTKKEKQGLKYQNINLSDLIKDALGKVTILAKQKDIKINTEVADSPFIGDKQELSRLLIILLDNAIKYSNKGSEIKIMGRHTNSQVIIEVQDQGIGIHEDELPFIFDRFYRVDKSRSQNNGHGLGLSIAKKIVDEHAGTIAVKSKVGEGSNFIVHLPIKQPGKVV